MIQLSRMGLCPGSWSDFPLSTTIIPGLGFKPAVLLHFLFPFPWTLSSSFMLGHPPGSQYQLLLFTFTLQKTIYARSYQFPKRFTWHLWLIPRFFHITICLHPMVLCKIQSFRTVLTHHQETPGQKWLFWTFEQLMKGVGFCFSREPWLIYHHNSSL